MLRFSGFFCGAFNASRAIRVPSRTISNYTTEHFPLAMKQNNQMSPYSSVISLMDNKTTYINAKKKKFRLKVDTVNEHLRKMEYAVRGVVPTKAGEIETAIKNVSVHVGIPNGNQLCI